MEKQRPEVVIESAEPLSDQSSESEEEKETRKRPTRLSVFSTASNQNNRIPKGMRPANSRHFQEQEPLEDEGDSKSGYPETLKTVALSHPLVLVAASLGIGILIAYYGVSYLRPAIEQVVQAAEELVDESE